jgi:S-disulfanyl-L-cysteine oxidoreductase SoxD
MRFRAVSQLLWPDRDREEWFSLRENHVRRHGSPGFPARGTHRGQSCAAFFTESRMQFDSTTKLHRKSGFGLHQLRNRSALLAALILSACGATWAQSPTYGVGKTPTPEQMRAEDISISPDGKNLPPGQGTAKEGAAIFAQKCAMCHGQNGSGGLAPILIKPETPVKSSTPCLSPCIGPGDVMALHAPYSTVMWDYINRAMPFKQEGSLKPDEVYSLTAFLLYKNGVIQEEDVLAQTTLPQVKMPNRNGYAIPDWKPGMPRPFPNGH